MESENNIFQELNIDPYKLLGITSTTLNKKELKNAYLKAAFKTENSGKSEEKIDFRLKLLKEAYKVILEKTDKSQKSQQFRPQTLQSRPSVKPSGIPETPVKESNYSSNSYNPNVYNGKNMFEQGGAFDMNKFNAAFELCKEQMGCSSNQDTRVINSLDEMDGFESFSSLTPMEILYSSGVILEKPQDNYNRLQRAKRDTPVDININKMMNDPEFMKIYSKVSTKEKKLTKNELQKIQREKEIKGNFVNPKNQSTEWLDNRREAKTHRELEENRESIREYSNLYGNEYSNYVNGNY